MIREDNVPVQVACSPTARDQSETDQRWHGLLLLLACFAVTLVSFRQTLFLMVETWYGSRSYSHCFLILPLFLYLVWIRRDQMVNLQPVPNYLGLPLIAGLALVWVLGNLAEVRLVQELAVVTIFIALVWTLMGNVAARKLAFPLLFLYFAVPFGTSLIRPLQDFTAWFVIHALTVSNVPAVLENHTISLPTGVWTVAEACSGIRFLLSSLVLGTFFAFLMYRSRTRRLIFVAASIVVPIVANGLRAYGIVMLGHLTDNKVAAGVDHIVYGAVFSIAVQLLLIIIGLRWREIPEPLRQIAPTGGTTRTRSEKGALWKTGFLAAMACALIALAPLATAGMWNRAAATAWSEPPVEVTAPWQAIATGDMGWAPEMRGFEKQFSQSYTNGTSKVDLDWQLYSGRRAMDFAADPDGLVNARSWRVADNGFVSAVIGEHPVKVSRALMQSGAVTRTVWTWYRVGEEYTGDRARVRLLQGRARLLGKSAEVAVISLGADNQTNGFGAEQALQEFLRHISFLMTNGAVRINQVSAPSDLARPGGAAPGN